MRKTVGFALTGSFCTFQKALATLETLKAADYAVIPIMSFNAYSLDTRFGDSAFFREKIEEITGNEIIHTIPQAEPIGPKKLLDALVICPCTGNTMAKLAAGIADTPVTLAAKSHLRNGRPLVIAVSTNDALSAAAPNIGSLKNRKHIYFVPFRQDDPTEKPNSAVADFSLVVNTVDAALRGEQLQPTLLGG
ncbi:MAG: dipicolinate synthase subunit B [Clostridia bacterium]|nr:dipicolinate synthase subunit B [Clostridia bacterium]